MIWYVYSDLLRIAITHIANFREVTCRIQKWKGDTILLKWQKQSKVKNDSLKDHGLKYLQ